MKIFALLFLVSFSFASFASDENDPVCRKKKEQYGKNYVSCTVADWLKDKTPLTSSYQPKVVGGISAKPRLANFDGDAVYKNKFPGIVGTTEYFDEEVALARKFAKIIELRKPNTTVYDEKAGKYRPLHEFLYHDWYARNKAPDKEQAKFVKDWIGYCDRQSGSSTNKDALEKVSVEKIGPGILCNGKIAFTRGEIKELLTALYPSPDEKNRFDFKRLVQNTTVDNENQDDANIALSRMGLLGNDKVQPAALIKQLKEAAESGNLTAMLGAEAGVPIWNQGVKKIVDVAYYAEQLSPNQSSSGRPYGEPLPVNGSVEPVNIFEIIPTESIDKNNKLNLAYKNDVLALEKKMVIQLMSAKKVSNSEFCAVWAKVSTKPCQPSQSGLLTDQSHDFALLKKEWLDHNDFELNDLQALRHELIVEHGVNALKVNGKEVATFAGDRPDRFETTTYSYVSLNKGDKPLFSTWAPSAHRISDICAYKDQHPGRAEVIGERKQGGSQGDGVISRTINADEMCKYTKDENRKRFIFTGPVSPGYIALNTKDPNFDKYSDDKTTNDYAREAYNELMTMLGTCPSFGTAAAFLDKLRSHAGNNELSDSEVAELKRDYAVVKDQIEVQDLKKEYDSGERRVSGFNKLFP